MFNNLYIPDAQEYRHHIIRADTFHLSAVNWSNIMMLGAIGLAFWMCEQSRLGDTNCCDSFVDALLFPGHAAAAAVGALPTLLTAQVAFNKLNKFALAPFKAEFPRPQAFPNWQTLELRNVTFSFRITLSLHGRINPTIKRRAADCEMVGKSTLAMLGLTGLYQPQSGEILLDGNLKQPEDYRNCFRQ